MSSSQKHTIATDALETLGTCPIPEGSGRDAIHLAVEPVIAGQPLQRGQYAKIVDGVAIAAVSLGFEDATGIVDPFIGDGYVRKGQKFWFVVLPRTITSLRHVWSHPAFPEEATYHKDDSDEHYMTPPSWKKALEHLESVAPPDPEQSMSINWLKDYCANELQERYEYVMAGAKAHIEQGEFMYGEHDSGKFDNIDLDTANFWHHYMRATKTEVAEEDRTSFFTCSC